MKFPNVSTLCTTQGNREFCDLTITNRLTKNEYTL